MPIKEQKSYSVVTGNYVLCEEGMENSIPKTLVSYSQKRDEVSLNVGGEIKIKASPRLITEFLMQLLDAVKNRVPEEEPVHDGPIDVVEIAEGLDTGSEELPKAPAYIGENEVPNIVKTIAFSSFMRKKLRADRSDIREGIRSIQKRTPDFDFIKVSEELKEMGTAAKIIFISEIADLAIKNAESELDRPSEPNRY